MSPLCFYLLHHFLQQGFVAVYYIINNIATGDGFKVFSRAVDLRFLNQSLLHVTHRSSSLCHEINVFYPTLIEGNRPVLDHSGRPELKYKIRPAA